MFDPLSFVAGISARAWCPVCQQETPGAALFRRTPRGHDIYRQCYHCGTLRDGKPVGYRKAGPGHLAEGAFGAYAYC